MVVFVEVKIFARLFYHNLPPPLKLNVSAFIKSLDISCLCSHNNPVIISGILGEMAELV